MQEFKRASLDLGTFEEFKENNKEMFVDFLDQEILFQYNRLLKDLIFMNDEYQVNVDSNSHRESPIGVSIVHLLIQRIDKEPIRDWDIIQEIKNIIVGNETDAVELFPAESRKVDAVDNQYHLWCLPIGQLFPVGWADENWKPNPEDKKPMLSIVK